MSCNVNTHRRPLAQHCAKWRRRRRHINARSAGWWWVCVCVWVCMCVKERAHDLLGDNVRLCVCERNKERAPKREGESVSVCVCLCVSVCGRRRCTICSLTWILKSQPTDTFTRSNEYAADFLRNVLSMMNVCDCICVCERERERKLVSVSMSVWVSVSVSV